MTISTGAKSRLISFELGAREAQGGTIPPGVASDASGVVEHIAL